MTAEPHIAIIPAESRFHTKLGWLDSRHSFSFGHHYDPAHVGHGQLIVLNDDRVTPGGGFGTHGHSDMEIVTWVIEGTLEHRDSTGSAGLIYPGLAQRMSAGSGIQHSEQNGSDVDPVHFIQMWVPPDTMGIEPSYEQADLNERLDAGGLVAVASGRHHDGAVRIHQRDAVMWVARLSPGEQVNLPAAPYVHAFMAKGTASLAAVAGDAGITLARGDAARLTDTDTMTLTAEEPSEVIVWESDSAARR